MPICTQCTCPVPYLYTVYRSMNNLRLEQCPNCLGFADPYVEHDALTLLLDLILLKREVYRHLLFNRGSEPRHMRQTGAEDAKGALLQWPSRSKDTWPLVVKLGLSLISMDAVIRWRDSKDITNFNRAFSQVLVACFLDTLLFHLGVTLASTLLLKSMDWFRTTFNRPYSPKLGTRTEFRIPLVSLTLFYSSLTKLLLLLLLAIWQSPISSPTVNSVEPGTGLPNYIAEHEHTRSALALLDESQFDRAWVIRNVLGGMSAGFGLRVLLDCHPILTTLVVLFGWCSKSLIAQCIDYWTGTNITFEYSIP
ncbi:Arv1-like family-domain-containing protein [Rhizoctonia solani]|nr:Arv1-like family-domain-containing protein [Rhizoctonia solani]